MNEQLNTALAALANKLGVGVEHLWTVLVQAQHYNGLISGLWAILSGLAVLAGIGMIIGYTADWLEDEAWMVFGLVGGVVGLIAFVINVQAAVICLNMPEYAAFKELMTMVTKR